MKKEELYSEVFVSPFIRKLLNLIHYRKWFDACEDGRCNISKGKIDDCYNCPYNFKKRGITHKKQGGFWSNLSAEQIKAEVKDCVEDYSKKISR